MAGAGAGAGGGVRGGVCWHLKRAASTTMWCKCPKLSFWLCRCCVFVLPAFSFVVRLLMCVHGGQTETMRRLQKSESRVKFDTCQRHFIKGPHFQFLMYRCNMSTVLNPSSEIKPKAFVSFFSIISGVFV